MCTLTPLCLTFCTTDHTLSTSALELTNLFSNNVRQLDKEYEQTGMVMLSYARRFSNSKMLLYVPRNCHLSSAAAPSRSRRLGQAWPFICSTLNQAAMIMSTMYTMFTSSSMLSSVTAPTTTSPSFITGVGHVPELMASLAWYVPHAPHHRGMNLQMAYLVAKMASTTFFHGAKCNPSHVRRCASRWIVIISPFSHPSTVHRMSLLRFTSHVHLELTIRLHALLDLFLVNPHQ